MRPGILCVALLAGAATSPAAEPPDYNRDVAPLFRKYCVSCHGAVEPEKGLVLESYDALLRGGASGAAIVPGNGDASRLLRLLDGRAQPAMPPEDNERPAAAEIARLKAWIDAGAKGPSGQAPDPTVLVTPRVPLRAEARRPIAAAAVSPDGKLLALAGYAEVRLISPESRGLVRKLAGLRGNVAAVSFTADGKQLLTAAGEPGLFGEAQLWSVADGKLLKTFTGHRDSLYAAVLSPDGKTLATGSYDQQIKLWDAAAGKELRTLAGHNGAVFDLAFHPTGKVLASASADRTVKLWDVASGARLDTLSQPLKELYTVAFSPDGKQVVAGGVDSRIRVWQLSADFKENTNLLAATRFAHEGAIVTLAFSSDGKLLASAGEDRTIKLWDAVKLVERRLLEPQSDWAPALAFAPDGKALLVGRLDGQYALYDTSSGAPLPPARPELAALEPRGLQRGTTTKVKLTGKNLLGAASLQLSVSPGKPANIKARLLPQDEARPGELLAEVTPSAKLRRGTYTATVVTPGGTSNPLTLYVDDLPQLAEAEPNGAAPDAALMPLPAASWGVVAARGDLDHFRFEARRGQTIVAELAARRIGSELNAMLTLLDPAGQVVAGNNDFDGQSDPLVAYTIPADGRYTVRVQDLAQTGSEKHFYRLAVGTFPYVTGVFPLSVPVGRETSVELAGYNLPPEAKVLVKPAQAGELEVPIDGESYRVGRTLKVLASDEEEIVETEPNDAPAQATPIPTSSGARIVHAGGRIWPQAKGQSSDVDLFRFDARKGQGWIIETTAARRGSPVDTRLEILDAQGKPVPRLLLQAVRDSYITFRPINADVNDARVKNWEEMELNEYLYMQGEVCKIFRMPQGPDSGFQFYASSGKRRGYFDTSATAHAIDDPCYIVEPHPPGTKLVPNGLPVFLLNYANDDDAERELGSDSRLMFTAPADGAYLVRVSDVRGFGGDRFAYRLTLREPKPDFQVRTASTGLTVNAGSGTAVRFVADRRDGFDEDITIEIAGLPAGFSIAQPLVIQAGHFTADGVLRAAPDAQAPQAQDWSQVSITARATIGGQSVVHSLKNFGEVKLAQRPKLLVRLEPAELTIAPGATITAQLIVERDGYEGAVAFDVNNLPHGVIVDNIGLNGILIPEKQSRRQMFLRAAPWVPETDRWFFAETKNFRASNAGSQSSAPVMLHVRKPGTLARAAEGK